MNNCNRNDNTIYKIAIKISLSSIVTINKCMKCFVKEMNILLLFY